MSAENACRGAEHGGKESPDSRLAAAQNEVKACLIEKLRSGGVRRREPAFASLLLQMPAEGSEVHLALANQQHSGQPFFHGPPFSTGFADASFCFLVPEWPGISEDGENKQRLIGLRHRLMPTANAIWTWGFRCSLVRPQCELLSWRLPPRIRLPGGNGVLAARLARVPDLFRLPRTWRAGDIVERSLLDGINIGVPLGSPGEHDDRNWSRNLHHSVNLAVRQGFAGKHKAEAPVRQQGPSIAHSRAADRFQAASSDCLTHPVAAFRIAADDQDWICFQGLYLVVAKGFHEYFVRQRLVFHSSFMLFSPRLGGNDLFIPA
jgi:hypothetical protein